MADLSTFSPNGIDVYNFKDSAAREDVGDIQSLIPSSASISNKLATMSDVGGGGSSSEDVTYPYASSITIENAVAANLAECKVKIDPTQDLHGYSKPWAAGQGKNLCPMLISDIKSLNTGGTWADNTYTVTDKYTVTLNTIDGVSVSSIIVTVKTGVTSEYFHIFNNTSLDVNQYILTLEASSNNQYLITKMALRYLQRNPGGSMTMIVVGRADIDSPLEFSFSETKQCDGRLEITNTGNSELSRTLYPMLRLASETSDTFEPYTNICPPLTTNKTTVTIADTHNNSCDYTFSLGSNYYGGTLFLSGKGKEKYFSPDWVYLSSYPGGNIGEPWISSHDEFISGTTPTIGAEVVCPAIPPIMWDEVDDPNPCNMQLFEGTNTISANTGNVSVTVGSIPTDIGMLQTQVNNIQSTVNDIQSTRKVVTFDSSVEDIRNAKIVYFPKIGNLGITMFTIKGCYLASNSSGSSLYYYNCYCNVIIDYRSGTPKFDRIMMGQDGAQNSRVVTLTNVGLYTSNEGLNWFKVSNSLSSETHDYIMIAPVYQDSAITALSCSVIDGTSTSSSKKTINKAYLVFDVINS